MASSDARGGRGGSAASQELPPGAELSHYRIEALIGRGGMGVVYRAHDLSLERSVALKLLAPELAQDERFRERFLRESRLAASLDHPAIVPIYEAGEAAGHLYIAMRLVEGTDLKRLLASERLLEPERTLGLLEQVAEALDAAHERGLVHRDVKPSNVLIDRREHVYLADFGLSRRLGEHQPLSRGGRSLGTVDYVAPEQIRGDELDGRTDIYSLGCLLYECLSGKPPFARVSDTAVVFAHLQEEPPCLPGMEPVIEKALAKAPDDRYGSGGELMDAARQALGLARPRPSRRPLITATVVLGLISAALLAFFLTRSGATAQAESGADSLVRIDPSTGQIVRTMLVGRQASGVAASGRYVWVTSFADGTVWRIDPKTRATLTIPVQGSPTGVAANSGAVLVGDGPEHSVVAVDPAMGAVSYVAPLPGGGGGGVPVAAGNDGAWFADSTGRIVGQVGSAVKGTELTPEITVPTDNANLTTAYVGFDGLADGEGAIWVAGDTFGRTIWRLDPASQRVVASIPLPFVPGSIAAGQGAVWVASLLDDTVARIDPATNRIVARIPVAAGLSGVAVGDGSVWAISSTARVVSRINPRTDRVVGTVGTYGTPTQIAVGAGGVWVTTTKAAPPVPHGVVGIGLLADCAGPYASPYEEEIAGAELALLHHGGRPAGARIEDGVVGARIAGKQVMLALGCTDGTAASAFAEARRLVDQVGVRILIGPTYATEELALQQYARRRPGVTFLNGTAAAQVLDPPPNFFSFTLDGAESMAGLATYAYRTLGWRHAVTVADAADSAVNWAQTAGFIAEFCSLGGTIVKRIWVPSGIQDYSHVVAQIPDRGVDGVVAAADQPTVVALADRYPGLRGKLARKLIIGVIAFPGPPQLAKRISGLVQAVYWQTAGRAGTTYESDLAHHFPQFGPSAWNISYYNAMTAAAEALAAVDGDLSEGERRFMAALARVRLDAPTGLVRLDPQREAIGTNYLERFPAGTLYRRVGGVEHTFGGYFTTHELAGYTTPGCLHRNPPSWTRSIRRAATK